MLISFERRLDTAGQPTISSATIASATVNGEGYTTLYSASHRSREEFSSALGSVAGVTLTGDDLDCAWKAVQRCAP